MKKLPVIIDCDPGQDDAISLLLAMSSPQLLEILGITTVAGNVPLDLTTRNARLMCDIAGRSDIAVFAGCAKPLQRQLITAEKVHGKTGIDGIKLVEPQTRLEDLHAVDFIIETLRDAEAASITLILMGPLTNIATALEKDPSIRSHVAEVVLMGGAMREGGNASPSAEFNILVDPHAADIVFRSGLPITVMGLDATHQVLSTVERRDRLRSIDNDAGRAAAAMLDFYNRFDSAKYGSNGAPLHDPCTVAYLLKPELFQGKRCNLTVETDSELTMGHTAVDFWHVTERAVNINWIHSVDADGFYDLLFEGLSQY